MFPSGSNRTLAVVMIMHTRLLDNIICTVIMSMQVTNTGNQIDPHVLIA